MRARGWTLVELVMVVVIVGMLAVFIGPLLLNTVAAYDRTEGTVTTYAKMRYAMERMAREVRAIRRNPADTTDFDIASMTPANFTFTREDGTQVSIVAAGGNVTLTYVGTGAGVLTDQVSAFNLAYYRQDGATAAAGATDVAFVEIAMTLADAPNSYPNRLRLALRNPQ